MDGFINFNTFDFNNGLDGKHNEFITEELLLTPLYKKIKDMPKSILASFPIDNKKIELYCNECKKRRIYTFATIGMNYYNIEKKLPFSNNTSIGYSRIISDNEYFYFIAKADCGHNLIILFKIIDENTIMKVGQSPSIYDMNEEINNKSFLKELGEEYASYYKTACSLNSFNSNIGAMTYLRRIFEKLLLDCFEQNQDELEITKNDFKRLKLNAQYARDELHKALATLQESLTAFGKNMIDMMHKAFNLMTSMPSIPITDMLNKFSKNVLSPLVDNSNINCKK